MASPTVFNLVRNRLATYVAPLPVLKWDDVDETIQRGTSPYMVVEDTAGAESLIGIGDSSALCNRETSSVVVYSFVRAPRASDTARDQSKIVSDLFRHYHEPNIRVVGVTPPDVEAMNDGLWTVGVVTITVEYDFQASLIYG